MKTKKRRRALIVVGIVTAVIVAGVGGYAAYGAYMINQISKYTFAEMVATTTKNNSEARITVGVFKQGQASYTVYGENGAELAPTKHTYEIGSVTKTLTAALLCKAVGEGKISMDDHIDQHLELPAKDYYPTLKRLITHTSGYKSHYLDSTIASNFLRGKNPFVGISTAQLLDRIGRVDLKDRDYPFSYSNFGMSVVGLVLSGVYGEDYSTLINRFVSDLGLSETMVSDGSGDLGKFWDWADGDAYIPAGALTSTIDDMLAYAQMSLDGVPEYLAVTHQVLAEVNATPGNGDKLNMRMDSVGAAWMLDTKNGIIWHNGGTGDYNSYLGFDPERRIAVVVLANTSPSYRIPATVMGARLLIELQNS